MTKKILSIVLSVLLLVSIVPNFAFAANEFAIAGNEVEYEIGQETKTVDVTFNVSNNPGITNAGLEVKFNPEVMTYKAIKSYGVVFTQSELTFGDINAAQGSLYLVYSNGLQNLTTNGELITITFEMAETVEAGTYEVQILEDDFSGGVSDTTAAPFDPVCTAATVTVKAAPAPLGNWKQVYTAEDLAVELAGDPFKNYTYSTVTDGGRTYFRGTGPAATTSSNAFQWTLNTPITEATKINHVVIGYRTNASGQSPKVEFPKTSAFDWNNIYFNHVTDNFAAAVDNVSAGTLKIDLTGKFADNGINTLEYFKFMPFNGQSSTSFDGTSAVYVDLEYIAFFENVADVNTWDYDAYLNPPLPDPTDDPEITIPAGAKPSQVSTLPYVDEDTGKFIMWEDEAGNLYSHNAAVSAETTLTVAYQDVELITPDIMASAENPLTFTGLGTSGATATGGLAADESYYRLFPTVKYAAHSVTYAFTAPKAVADLGAVRYSFAQSWVTGNSPWVYYGEGTSNDTKVPYPYVTTASDDGLYHHDVIAPTATVTADTISQARLILWGGDIWQKGSTYPLDDVYADIYYVALFADATAAAAFDFDAYTTPVVTPPPVNEYTVTFQNKDGGVISTDTYEEGETVTLPTAPAVDGFTFAGWSTGVEGEDLVTENFTATADVTLKATYTENTPTPPPAGAPDLIYTAQDIIDLEMAKGNGNVEVQGLVEVTDAAGYSSEYVRYVVKSSKIDGTTAGNKNDFVLVYLPEGVEPHYANPHVANDESDYKHVVVGYKTNIAPDTNVLHFVYAVANGSFNDAGTEPKAFNTYNNRVGTDTTTKLQQAMSAKLKTAGTSATANPVLDYVRFLPYGNPTASNAAIVYTAEQFFDIEYVAFFADEADATAFDYADYVASLTPPANEYTVTFQNKDGGVISTDTYTEGETVTLPTAPAVDGFTFAGWSTGVEGEDLVTENFTATADVTLKATYTENAPEGAEEIAISPDALLEQVAGKSATLSVVTEGGKTYLRATMAGNAGHGINWTLDPVVDATVYDVVKIGFRTNAGLVTNRAIALQASKDNTFNWQNKYFDAAKYSYWPEEAATEVTVDEIVFDMTGLAEGAGTDTLQYFRILPFNGQATTPIAGDTTLYFDIEYVAFFDSTEAAENFTYVAPAPTEYTVTFQNKDGGVISTDTYTEGETVTLPTAPAVDGYTFLGWSTGVEGEDLVTEDFTATADVTLKATYEETQGGGEEEEIDCVIVTTDDIVAGDNPDNIQGVGGVGNVLNYGLVDGMAKFAVSANKAGTASTTTDRLAIKVDNVLFKDYPYAVIAYETNIAAPNFNFNIATANGTYSTAETKIFAPQTRVTGELTTAKYTYTGSFGDTAEVVGVYVPIYSNTAANYAEGDYMSVKYVGFFKNATDADAFDYEAYIESLEGGNGGEGGDLEDDEDTEYLGTFIAILKMISAKKKAGGTTSTTTTTTKGIVYNAEDIIANRAVTEGVDTYNGKEGKLPGGKVTFSAVDGKVRFAMPAGAASGTGDRAIIKVDDVKLSEYPYYAIKYNTNIAADNINFNLTTKDGTYSGAEQKIFAPVAREVGKDAVCIAKYDGKMGDAVATFIYVPIYSNTSAVAADGDYFDVEAVGFFKTEKEANDWAK